MSAAVRDHALEARYLGGAMLDVSVMQDQPLPIAAFDAEHHRRVHEAMLTLFVRGERISADSLDAELATLGYHADRNRQPFDRMAQAFLEDPAAVAGRLRELMARRQLLEGMGEIMRGLEDGRPLANAQADLRRLAELPGLADEDRTALVTYRDLTKEAAKDTRARAAGEARLTITTGLPALDKAFDGWDRGDLIVLAGDPNAGKSSTMLAMARAQARAGERVLICSFEDGRVRWGRRSLAGATGVPLRALKRGDLSDHQWSMLEDIGSLEEADRIFFAFPLGGTTDEMIHCARRARHQHGVTKGFFDYLQAMGSGDDERELRHQIRERLEAARRETALGDEPFTITFGSQYKKREDTTKRPTDSDLYEAAYIHQKADVILHLWRDKQGARRWAMTKHKDEDGCEGLLLLDRHTRLLAATGDVTPLYGAPRHEAEQRSFDDGPNEFSDDEPLTRTRWR